MIKVSVIIPAYNAARFIEETITSILDQATALEVIVIDDGSIDGTSDLIRDKFPMIKLGKATGKGAQSARNQALLMAEGEYVKFLDADDILLPGSLLHQIRIADSLPANSISYGPAVSMTESGLIGGLIPHFPRPSGMRDITHILFYSPLTSCPLHRRNLLLAVGGMDESLPREHENDLHIRLVLSGVSFVYDNTPVYAYRQHTTHFSLMSGGVLRFGETWMLKYLQMQEERLIRHFGGTLPIDVAKALALFYWKSGRSVLREGSDVASHFYFDAARRVSPKDYVCGRLVYQIIVRFLGPIRAERLMTGLRMFRNEW